MERIKMNKYKINEVKIVVYCILEQIKSLLFASLCVNSL